MNVNIKNIGLTNTNDSAKIDKIKNIKDASNSL